MDNLLQIQIRHHILDIAEPENSVASTVIPDLGKDHLPVEVSPKVISGSLPRHLLIILSHINDVLLRLKADLVATLLKLLIRDADILDQIDKVHQNCCGQLALAYVGGDNQVGPGTDLVLLTKSVLLVFCACDTVKESVHGPYHLFIKMIDYNSYQKPLLASGYSDHFF